MFNLNTWGMTELLFARLVRDKKLYLVILMLIAILDEYTGSARNVVMQYSIHVSGWGSFACLTSYSFLMLWIVAGYLILLSDTPYITELSIYECVRITPWQSISARLIYIIVVSISYTMMTFLLSSLIQLASFVQMDKWDKALYTMSRGHMVADSFLYIPSVIVTSYTPIAAWLVAVGLLILVLALLGIAMFFVSIVLNRQIAICMVSLWAALDFAISYMMLNDKLYSFSPLSWGRVEMLELSKYDTSYPSSAYCIMMLFILIGLFLFLCKLVSHRHKRFADKFILDGDKS